MTNLPHENAAPSHYDEDAKEYDLLNEEHSQVINQVLDEILKKQGVKTVLDMTCGTGSQVFWLARHGYHVTGSDINAAMLDVAREKAGREQLEVTLLEGDMRTLKVGKFEAVITIFNAVGHLTKEAFEQAIQNIHDNLTPEGLYIFDIFNLAYLLNGDNITKLTIDWQKMADNKKVRKIQYSTINEEGVLASFTTSITHAENKEPLLSEMSQTLQVYTPQQLVAILERNGFEVLSQTAADGSALVEDKTERILTVAKKL